MSLHRNSGFVILQVDRSATHEGGPVPKTFGIEKTRFPLSREWRLLPKWWYF